MIWLIRLFLLQELARSQYITGVLMAITRRVTISVAHAAVANQTRRSKGRWGKPGKSKERNLKISSQSLRAGEKQSLGGNNEWHRSGRGLEKVLATFL